MTDNNSEIGTKRMRRATRYQKAQERRHQHAASDNKFYAAMSSIMTILALLVVLVGALMLGGGSVDTSAMAGLAEPWLGPFTQLEVFGVIFVVLIAGIVYLRMRKR